ncbi:extensin family protein [Qipengyuania sp. S6317L1]|uniref:extensin-like domain-containing protein n=1 Tax=Qipengyuania sp. S6317L1 TaxID=2926410 RepID=UPI001FF6D011|nr:extensin family protein [Qipengyuania sp. S6317L1]MCK0100528.1 extensin family protein [Qipengyuania sp. S6317L1]
MPAKKTSKGLRVVRRILVLGLLAAVGMAGWNWLEDHPQHNPWAPLDLRDPIGLATATKLVTLRDDIDQCRAVLERSDIAYTALPQTGEGACVRPDRTRLTEFPFSPGNPATTCPVAAAMELWRTRSVEPAARDILGSGVARFEHLGVYNCRRIRGSSDNWSQHATGNAIDISAIVLEDGRRISLLAGWEGESDEAQFLRQIRDGACGVFAVVLSPDYNAAHADHFHFDQGGNMMGVCR